MGSARKGIDDGVSHAPPDVMLPALNQFYERLERDAGLVVNRSKTQVYSPNGNSAGMPQAFQIVTITATLTGEDASSMLPHVSLGGYMHAVCSPRGTKCAIFEKLPIM
jgi:hypothetical protein